MTAVTYELMYVLPVSFTAVLLIIRQMPDPERAVPVYLCAGLMIAVCAVLRHVKGRYKYLAPGMCLALCAGIIMIQPAGERAEFIAGSKDMFFVAVIIIMCYFAGIFLSSYRPVRSGAALCLIAGLISTLFIPFEPGKAETSCILFLILLAGADEVQHFRNKIKDIDPKDHMVSLAPVFIITVLLVFIAPAPDKPYDWALLRNLCSAAVSGVKTAAKLFHGQDEDYGGIIGFSDSGKIGGSLKADDKEIMDVTFMMNTGSVIYLKGKVMDSFSGREWEASYRSLNSDDKLDALETMCAVYGKDPEHIASYAKEAAASLKYLNFNTGYVFAPGKMLYASGVEISDGVQQIGGDLRAAHNLGYGTDYIVKYIRLNDNEESLKNLTEETGSYEPDQVTWEMVRKRYNMTGEGTSFEDYLEYRKNMEKYYLTDKKVSKRTEELLDSLLKGASSDHEKLRRIEEYLRTFEYTLSPDGIPDNVRDESDFLDWFLFDAKKGYCAHFTTAFVLMARECGIPARYVQGFRVQAGSSRETSVRSYMAHAWPEAYIEGVGWMRYEPAPGMDIYNGWGSSNEEAKFYPGSDTGEVPGDSMDETEGAGVDSVASLKGADSFDGIMKALIPLGAALAFLMLFLITSFIITRLGYRRLGDAERFRLICKKNLRLLKHLGIVMEQGETLEELEIRARVILGVPELRFIRDYEAVLYAGRAADKNMCRIALDDRHMIYELIKERRGKVVAAALSF